MHEAILKDRLCDVRNAFCLCHQGPIKLRLQVGRECREGLGAHINRVNAMAIAPHAYSGIGCGDFGSGLRKYIKSCLQKFRRARLQAEHLRRSWRQPLHMCPFQCGQG
jgi:hypothetical protein